MLDRLEDLCARWLPDAYAPHTRHAFDGPFTRFSTPHGTFIQIMSSVWDARTRPHLGHVSFTPLPSASPSVTSLRFFEDFYPDRMHVDRRRADDKDRTAAFTLACSTDRANLRYSVDHDVQRYRDVFQTGDGRQYKLDIDITEQRPHSLLGPMWISRFFPLPIYWHTFSLRSRAHITLKDARSGQTLLETDGDAHQEKNWGTGFPSGGWLWGQGFTADPGRRGSFCFAGGDVFPGLRSLFLSLRSPTSHRAWDFGPAGTVQLFGWGPGIRVSSDSKQGQIEMVVTDWLRGRRACIKGRAPVESFLDMSAPMPEGHRPGYCHEAFDAEYDITLEERRWSGLWPRFERVEGPWEMEEGAPLEFGGNLSHWHKSK